MAFKDLETRRRWDRQYSRDKAAQKGLYSEPRDTEGHVCPRCGGAGIIRPHKCQLCGRWFKKLAGLVAHERMHERETNGV